jgi:hypothetical protein
MHSQTPEPNHEPNHEANHEATQPGAETACSGCPLRALKLLVEPTGDELELVQLLKRREQRL